MGISYTWGSFDDVGPAGGVGDLLSFMLLEWWFLAAGHGDLLESPCWVGNWAVSALRGLKVNEIDFFYS